MHENLWPGIFAQGANPLHAMSILQTAKVPRSLYRGLLFSSLSAYIKHNISRRITVEDLARLANLNAFQLLRVFQREYATTPYALVLDIRIERAKELLTSGVKIADVAIDTGFSDQSHLTRHFRRREGMTPKAFLAGQAMRVPPAGRGRPSPPVLAAHPIGLSKNPMHAERLTFL
jgi:AraC-like DNA-binding protein